MICLCCRQPLVQFESGAFARCCNGVGYFYAQAPMPRDSWWPHPKTSLGYVYRNWFKRCQP